MKTKINLGNIEFNGIKLSNISLEQEYSAKEAVELAFAGKSFVKSLIKDLPEMILDLDKAFETFNEVDSKYENIKDFVKEETVEAYKEYTTPEEACDFVNISLRDLLNRF